MLFTHLKQLVLRPSISAMPNALLPALPSCVVDCSFIDLSAVRLASGVSLMKSNYFSYGFTSSFILLHSSRSLHSKLCTGDSCNFTDLSERKSSTDGNEEQFLAENFQAHNFSNSVDNINGEDDKEIQRRRRIGLANKGKVPWNKGRKHGAETREKIRQRTREALSDPKVRKKMAVCPRSLSNQTKARIGSSLRNLWGQRLKWKRSRETFLQSWAESIARAAKIGWSGQQELDWDSYDKMKKEIALEKLQWAAAKAKVKNMPRIQAERKVRAKAEKRARLAHKKEQEEKANNGNQSGRKTDKKSQEEKEGFAVAREFKLKVKLTKIRKKKTMTNQLSFEQQQTWEKFDLEFMKKEKLQKAVSLEDQIRVAKTKRVNHTTQDPLLIYLPRDNDSNGTGDRTPDSQRVMKEI